jgi:hypothetical protein
MAIKLKDWSLLWVVDEDEDVPAGHYKAEAQNGTYRIGMRQDGRWEYSTPDTDWGEEHTHSLFDFEWFELAIVACEDHYKRSTGEYSSESSDWERRRLFGRKDQKLGDTYETTCGIMKYRIVRLQEGWAEWNSVAGYFDGTHETVGQAYNALTSRFDTINFKKLEI